MECHCSGWQQMLALGDTGNHRRISRLPVQLPALLGVASRWLVKPVGLFPLALHTYVLSQVSHLTLRPFLSPLWIHGPMFPFFLFRCFQNGIAVHGLLARDLRSTCALKFPIWPLMSFRKPSDPFTTLPCLQPFHPFRPPLLGLSLPAALFAGTVPPLFSLCLAAIFV